MFQAMPWPAVLPFIIVVLGLNRPWKANAESNVGCLFSESLCLDDEWCYDDFAFGRCLESTGDLNQDDLYKYDLEREYLHQLSRELKRLFALGYRWSHAYTQCRLQAMLYSIKNDIPFEDDSCTHLVDQDLESALKVLEADDPMDPHEMAIIKYTPSVNDPHSDFADEVYYPPVEDDLRETVRERIMPSDVVEIDMEDPYAEYVKRNVLPPVSGYPREHQDLEETYALIELLDRLRLNPEQIRALLNGDYAEDNTMDPWERFTLTYNTPDSFRAGWESRDDVPESRVYYDEDDVQNADDGSGIPLESKTVFREVQRQQSHGGKLKNIYTEGGMVVVPDSDDDDVMEGKWDDGFWDSFKRPERLDVKKPGPLFANGEDTLLPSMMKKEPRGVHPDPAHELNAHDGNDYIFVKFKNNINAWKQGEPLIKNISALIHLEPKDFTHGKVEGNEISFKLVVPNSKNLNSTEVARRIEKIKDKLVMLTGEEVKGIKIGDKEYLPTTSTLEQPPDIDLLVYILVALVVAILLGAAIIVLIRRNMQIRDKLKKLTEPDTEASKDYQDLCRARMATKQPPPAAPTASSSDTMHGRIASLSRESEPSPSSRSSTSSWSEEPALHNMDISTGHMVLSYMEDHLKNKDRLEREWEALCAYVAEPCEVTIAMRNEAKNRCKDIVPYDHSRVVLNELTNASNNDYINASSITDHDPRNPAYIATQGPLPHTAPDFWQLIWEQGAVVIVMLTRLTENGQAMCHRYWPEEGSELYHIYEVHLVSEHIWCDDYLVRSFYLKNIKTGETRTVTQFHFLSWPESGCPSSTKALLEFRRKVNKSYRGRSCPIVVHCSDGAGRTGTYCLIDMVLSRMAKGAKEIDIAATLEHLRDQRAGMVATKQQFEFVLTAVAEEVHAILKALPPQAQEKEKP